MANIKSQKKRNLTNAKAADRNKAVRAELKTRIKTATKVAGTESSADTLKIAQKRLDQAASKGVIHRNAAARRNSRLARKVNAAG